MALKYVTAIKVLRPGEYFNRLGSAWVNEAELEPYLPTEEELNKSEKAEE